MKEYNPWLLYDRLLEPISSQAVVQSCIIGPLWTIVQTSVGMGISMTPPYIGRISGSFGGKPVEDVSQVTTVPPCSPHANRFAGRMVGMPLCELAELVKSWELGEAAVGLAALNAWHNNRERMSKLECRQVRNREQSGLFGSFSEEITGKKVAIIGHFPNLTAFKKICNLSVLERALVDGDYPDSSCEYILPDQDYVFITATALQNKTMPRLLQLCQNSFTVIWGPSTPATQILFEFGADALVAESIRGAQNVMRISAEGGTSIQFAPYMDHWLLFKE